MAKQRLPKQCNIDNFQHYRTFDWTVLYQWMNKRPPLPSNHSPLFKSQYFHTPHTHIWSFNHRLSTSFKCTSISLSSGMRFTPSWPINNSTYPYQPLEPFQINASSLSPHLPLALAEPVASTGLCLYLHYNIDPSGLQIIVCVLCLSHKITSSLRTGILLLIWGFPNA